ncbi:uncharacterized protein LOC143912183 [Arctopsyche grandis]|uniref:uncharacterized protein LOC143912183 n=1 Tax=Arctopsyche grandis TaxID=121162 RepID=UPI00406D7113
MEHARRWLWTMLVILCYLSISYGSHLKISKRETPKVQEIGTNVNPADPYKNRESMQLFTRLIRNNRQTELMDLEATKTSSYDEIPDEEEESFWGKVARVCLNLLKKFLSWMNN